MTQTVKLKGNDITVNGVFLQAGSKAKPLTLVTKDLSEATLETYEGKRKVLNIFPSVDTGVCAASVRKFNQLANDLDNTVVLCISADLPFAQARFVVTLSSFRSDSFANDYGVAIASGPLKGLNARSVVVLDENNNVIYSQLVPEITEEPDYDSALNSLK